MTATPIPAGVRDDTIRQLTRIRDDFRRSSVIGQEVTLSPQPQGYYSDVLSDALDLLAGPARPDGVPDDLVSAALNRLCDLGGDDHGHTDCWIIGGLLTVLGVPVPRYQPTLFALTDPTCGICGWVGGHHGAHGDLHHAQHVPPPVTEARTGPDAVAEARYEAAKHRAIQARLRAGDDLALEERIIASNPFPWEASMPVARWDAEDAPATPDPDTITVNLPRATAEWMANNYATGPYPGHMRTAGRAAAAGLPQEPTDTRSRPTREEQRAHLDEGSCRCHDSWDQCPCAEGGHPTDGSCNCCPLGTGLCGPRPQEPTEGGQS